MISIVTVCYNSEKTLARTIESVLKQNVDELEYILVDGDSTDSTLDIIRQYEEKFIKKGWKYFYISEKDAGMYDAMNKGIRIATGNVIGILNSDDWYEENALSIVTRKAESVNADIYMGAINVINGSNTFIKKANNRAYKTSRDFNHPAMFVTALCYEQVGNYEIDNVHDDYGWYLKALKQGKIVSIIDDVLTNYPTGGIGSKKSIRNTLERIGTKYRVYKNNGYSKLYFWECVAQEIGKYILLKG